MEQSFTQVICIWQDSLKTIQQISQFLGFNHSKEFCEEVVRLVSLENMKAVEQHRMGEFHKQYSTEGNAGFVRTGKCSVVA